MAEQSILNLDELRVRPVERSEEARHHELMAAHHYLGFLPKIGETLWYGHLPRSVGGVTDLFRRRLEMRRARSVDRLEFSPSV